MRLLAIPFFLCIVCINVTARAQERNSFTSYSTEEGLAQSSVLSIAADKEGFMWMGTSDGVCRFDGYNFTNYKHNPKDSASICSNSGYSFFTDSTGRLWVVSAGGISIYNPATNNFTNIITYHNPFFISFNCIYGEDKTFIWAGLCGYGLVNINKHNFTSSIISLPATEDPQDNYASFSGFLSNGKLWISKSRRLFVYNTATTVLQTIANPPAIALINVNDTTAFGVNNAHCLLVNKKTLACRTLTLFGGGIKIDVSFLYRLNDSVVLLCSNSKGVFYYNTRQAKITGQISSIPSPDGPKPLFAKTVFKDASGNLWIGTSDNGVVKLAAVFKHFKIYRAKGGNSVTAIYAKGDTLFGGYYGSGLNMFSRQNGFIKNISVQQQTGTLLNNAYSIAPFSTGRLLLMGSSAFFTHNNLLFTLAPASGELKVLNNSNEYVLPNYWYKVANRQFLTPHTNNSLLTGISEYLVQLTQNADGSITAKIVKYFNNESICCCYSRNGIIWVGTMQGAWFLTANGWQKASLPAGTEVRCINEDSSHNMWLGTLNGIYTTTPGGKITAFFTEKNGLANGHVYGILKDDSGNMWFSHNRGLSVYRWAQKQFKNYTVADGLQADEFNGGAYFKAADGELFFGGVNGITAFYPAQVGDNTFAPAASITGIKLFDEPLKTAASYGQTHNLNLPFNQNSLSFEYTGLEFTNPAKNRFAYIMQGLDKKWIDAGTKRFARYAGLAPGTYTFIVKAANADGVWGKPVSIAIYISPPYWRRTWFVALQVLVLAAVVALGVYYLQKRKYRKKLAVLEVQHKLQVERERISRELHDNVGTQLILINKNIEDVLHPLKAITDEERTKKVRLAGQSSSEVMAALRETIWALHRQQITLEEFADQLKTFTQKQVEPYDTINVVFKEGPENSKVIVEPAEVLNLFRICQETITNTIKYAGATQLDIGINAAGGKYCITIADNGKGFNPAQVDGRRHYGLQNIRHRAAEINGLVEISSRPGAGAIITVSKK